MLLTMGSLINLFSTLILRFLPINLSDIMYICKKILSHLYFRLYRRLNKGRLDHHEFIMEGEPENVGFISHPTEWQLESPQSELQLVRADDEIFFYGVNSKGEYLVVSVSRLSSHRAEAIIYLKLASGKTYRLDRSADFQQSTGEQKVFSCGGLQLYTLQPMRRWRIFYSGYLKDISDDSLDVQEAVYVKFSFLWGASSDVYDSTFDLNESLIVKSVAKAEWKHIVPPINKLFESLNFYAQSGVVFGTVSVDDVVEDHEMYLFGEKIRFLGNASVCKEMETIHTLGFLHENGTFLHFGETTAANIAEKIKFGFVVQPDGDLKTLEKLKLSKKTDRDTRNVQEISGKMEAGRTYKFCGSVTQPVVQMMSSKNKILNVHQVKFHVNGKKGSGIQIKWKIQAPLERKISHIDLPVKIPECVHPMITAFTEDLCQLPDVAGGKGSSLGKLTALSGELLSFSVPPGFVVTTSSYKHFINTDILEEIKVLEDVLYGNKDGDTKEACKRVRDKIIATNFPNPVLDNIVRNLTKIFGDEYRTKTFAVRSSATGEDTEQMSAAGQMETYLGVRGLNQVLSAIKKCWASQFGFTAIEYKRRYGQCLNAPMAVVIQEMVACNKAGVIFTCDPLTDKSNRISIAANFGLGESVVSSAVDPDTIDLIRFENDELRINTVTVGSKSKQVILSDGGTRLENISENAKQECCLSTNEIFRLGDLAIKIEKNFRSKRDIEWGIQNGKIYIFQSRPVTSGSQETNFEIEHEFDAPLRLENDYFSVANAGEVLPGAIPPLSRDIYLSAFHIFERGNYEVETSTDVKTRYFLMGWLTFYSHLMINIPDIFYKSHIRSQSPLTKEVMASSVGVTLDDEEIFKVIEERYRDVSNNISLKALLKLAKVMLCYGKRLEEGQKRYQDYRIAVEEYHTSKDLFHALLKHCCDLSMAHLIHTCCSTRCALKNMMLLATLCQGKETIDNDAYADFAKLITSGENFDSADVPSSVQNLAFHISKSIDPDAFKSMKYEEALAWLTDTSSSIGKRFREFIEKHGHRGFREIDIYSPSWRADPKPLIQLLQSKVGNVSEEASSIGNPSVRKLINELKTPTGLMTKLKLMFLVPKCWNGVQGREASKSLLVKALDAWRAAYWHLAKLMVSEGRIPEQKILFFMTIEEIKELLDNRSPTILARAYRREKLFPQMNEYVFPDVIRGFPKPINTTDQDYDGPDENLCMKGLPVSQGIARGFLRVAITIDEAACVKPGEILLTYATDVGWSPYFPSLAGVATELGGLLSHGAVVSREYGLPCVVGLPGATRRFRTGDYVLLDGTKGVLKRIPAPERCTQEMF